MNERARDVMQKNVLTVSPEASLLDVHRLLVEEGISGAPVEDDGVVVGVVSATDLVRATCEEHDTGATHPFYMRELLEFSGPDWSDVPEDFQDRLAKTQVADVMSREPAFVTPDASVAEIVECMLKQRVHRVLVVEDGTLVGIISPFDLLELLR